MMRPLRLIPPNTAISFLRFAPMAGGVSFLSALAALGLWLAVGLNLGIDFTGGMLIEIRTSEKADIPAVRSRLSSLGVGEVQAIEFGRPTDVLLRVSRQPGGERGQQEAFAKIRDALGEEVEIRRQEVVGPSVSGELAQWGFIAVAAAVIAVLIYIWFRFEWQFSLGAIAALIHDVLVTIGAFSALRLQFDLSIVAALLTIVGYSLNDTVVVYDRVRENLRKFKKMPIRDLLDKSVNETLSRTALTSLTTLLALGSLYVFGGEVMRGFVFAMIWGVVIGTYSSVFIAAPLLPIFGVKRDWSSSDSDGVGGS